MPLERPVIGDGRRFWSLVGAYVCFFLAAVLLVILLGGCRAPLVTGEEPTTEGQLAARDASYQAARAKGVRLDAVVFAPGPVTGTKPGQTPGRADAWALCGQYAIGWNERSIEVPGYLDFECSAAHEVCHIFYRDNLPCKKEYDESRARRCASALVERQCSGSE